MKREPQDHTIIIFIDRTQVRRRARKVDMTQGYMKDDIGYTIVLFSRVMGLLVAGHLNIWMVYFIATIRMTKLSIDWGTILSDNLDKQLVAIKANPKFYITS